MAGSSTAELRLRPAREDDLDYVVAAEADPDNAPFLAPSRRVEHVGRAALRLVEVGTLHDALHTDGRFEKLIVMSLPQREWTP